ncbi:DNA polymerase zeta catalytic subunit [Sphaceloma murrayae]|uniref:DNA polymerase zeta catalytic subunit n=1 Tax=Sphaceloma murrayae TaxID=2082308 RepID=A0A2K1QXQ1_9PEZI|nr:DNA polymerase zeta catalytic subunit [Sphaceloma murrayae]
MSLRAYLIVYVAGGLTFVPLVLLSVFSFAYFTLPRSTNQPEHAADPSARRLTSDSDSDLSRDDGFVDKEDAPGGSGNDAAGYFAVCREYVPGGINGKPPERASPAGEVLNTESPSVYQSMYRSIFERGKTQTHALEGDKKDYKAIKRPRNVFFVVLRHEHLLLFDNSDQLEVRHVISLLYHDVDLYGGDEELVEGDLWIKKNCIRLTRRSLPGHPGPMSQPFYIFSDNCSDKEDFYHSLLLAQSSARATDSPLSPQPRKFETDHIIKLVKALHTTDSDHHARWFNGLLGRIFLALYKTDDIKSAIKAKIDRKISRVPKPNFISTIQVQGVDMGDSAPVFSNFKLKELMVDGSLTVEADVKYNGGFRLQIAAIARIELGSRIRAREVDLVLAGVLRKLSGHILFKIKPPPSNRIWISFETIPQMDIDVEPVVSSMQITYGVILRAIESRIREVVGETLVYPNWDDMPFFDTEAYECRGGIWDTARKSDSDKLTQDSVSEIIHSNTADDKSPDLDPSSASGLEDIDNIPPISPKTTSMPNLLSSPTKDVPSRKLPRKTATVAADSDSVSTSVSRIFAPVPAAESPRSKPTSPRLVPADKQKEKPKAMRSNSFASAATPLVSTDDALPTNRTRTPKSKGQMGAVDYVKEVKSRSESMTLSKPSASDSSHTTSIGDDTPDGTDGVKRSNSDATPTPAIAIPGREAEDVTMLSTSSAPSATFPLPDLGQHRKSWNLGASPPGGAAAGSAFEKATSLAKNWGISMMNRQTGRGHSISGFTSLAREAGIDDDKAEISHEAADVATTGQSSLDGNAERSKDANEEPKNRVVSAAKSGNEKEPMGRGQPLPPPGAPLPGPKQSLWSGSSFGLPGSFKRKAALPTNTSAESSMSTLTGKSSAGDTQKADTESDGTVRQEQGPEKHHQRTPSGIVSDAAAATNKNFGGEGHGRRRRASTRYEPEISTRDGDEIMVVPSPELDEESEKDDPIDDVTDVRIDNAPAVAYARRDPRHQEAGTEGISAMRTPVSTSDRFNSQPSPSPLPARRALAEPPPVPPRVRTTEAASFTDEPLAPERGTIDTAPASAVAEEASTGLPLRQHREEIIIIGQDVTRPPDNPNTTSNIAAKPNETIDSAPTTTYGSGRKGKGGWYTAAFTGGLMRDNSQPSTSPETQAIPSSSIGPEMASSPTASPAKKIPAQGRGPARGQGSHFAANRGSVRGAGKEKGD